MEELTHFGVKGMRWGVRKSKDLPTNKARDGSPQKQKARKMFTGSPVDKQSLTPKELEKYKKARRDKALKTVGQVIGTGMVIAYGSQMVRTASKQRKWKKDAPRREAERKAWEAYRKSRMDAYREEAMGYAREWRDDS